MEGTGDVPQLVAGSYIVTLQPNLARQVYEEHFNALNILFRTQRLKSHTRANIENVFMEPIGSTVPALIYYFATFDESVAKAISLLPIVLKIHQEHVGHFDITGLSRVPTPSWGLASISHTQSDFLWQQLGPYYLNSLPGQGEGSTIYVIDSGFQRGCNIQGSRDVKNELSAARKFIDTVQYRNKLRESQQAHFNSSWPVDEKDERYLATFNQVETDDWDSHGTNVSLLVGSNKRGTAAKAKVVTIRAIGDPDSKRGLCLHEKNILTALQIINNRDPGTKTVVNCSWRMSFSQRAHMNLIISQFEALRQKGVTIVASAGNGGKNLIRRGDTDTATANDLDITLDVPRCLSYAYLVGSLKDNEKKSSFSNYIGTSTGTIPITNRFIWVPGEKLPCIARDWITGDLFLVDGDGTSYATPLVAGVVACVLTNLAEGETLEDKMKPLLKPLLIKGCSVQNMLRWEAD